MVDNDHIVWVPKPAIILFSLKIVNIYAKFAVENDHNMLDLLTILKQNFQGNSLI